MGTRRPELRDAAMDDLRRIGFKFVGQPSLAEGFGSSTFIFENKGKEVRVLVQTRGEQLTKDGKENERYWVGLMYPDVCKVDFVAIWFQGRDKLLVLPKSKIVEIWDGSSHRMVNGNQWSVNVEYDLGWICPTGMNGYHYDVPEYFFEARVDSIKS